MAEMRSCVDHRPRQIRRDGEADADRAARRRVDRRVDADHLAVHVEHRAAGIAAVDRGVGLDEVVIGAGIDVARARREDARGHRAAQAERVADSEHPVADAGLVAVAEFDRGQRLVGLDSSSARSTLVSRPTTSALKLVSSCRVTVISSASAMTWLLVTTRPEGSMMKPEPSEVARAAAPRACAVCCDRGSP